METAPNSTTALTIRVFDNQNVREGTFRGKRFWLARDVGRALGYAKDGASFLDRIAEWGDELEPGKDIDVFTGPELRALKELIPDFGTSHAASIMVIYEPGMWIALARTTMAAGKRLRRVFADEWAPQLARDGRYLPEREVTPAGELRDRDAKPENVIEWDEQVTQVGEARADRAAEREARLAEQRERTRQIELETAAAREAAQAERLRVEAVDRHAGAAELSALADDVAERDRALAARLRVKQLEHAYGVALGELGELYVTAMAKPPDALTAAMAIVGGVQAPAPSPRRPRVVMPPGRTSAGREALTPGWHWCTDIALALGVSPGVLGKRVVKPLGIKGDQRYSRLATIDSRDGTRHQVYVYNDAGRELIEAKFRELDAAGAFRKRGKTNGVRAQA